jgi:hypothetical protein
MRFSPGKKESIGAIFVFKFFTGKMEKF